MDDQSVTSNQVDGEIDYRELFAVLWSSKIKIIVITAIFALGSVINALSIPNQFKATALLAPAQLDGVGLSSALELGGTPTLNFFRIGGPGDSESQIAQQIMKSWSFAESFITENDLAVEIYAVKGIRGARELEVDDNIYDLSENQWLIKDSNGNLGPPSSWQLFEKFSRMLSISEDKTSGLVSVSIEYFTPEIAKKWLDMYIAAVNKHMQTRQITKVSNNIAYLEVQIDKTPIAEMREVFYTIIEEQTKKKMVAEASPDYAFVTVSPAMVPEVKSRPNRALICILGTLFGGVLSSVLVLFSHYFWSSKGKRKYIQ